MAAKKKKTVATEEELANPRTPEQFRLSLRRKTRLFYDIQSLRLQAQGRLTKKAPEATIELHPRDLEKLKARVGDLETAEGNALKDLEDELHEVPFYREVIEPKRKDQYRGLGPKMASVIISSFDIKREETVSQMWAFAGLAPIPAQRCKHCSVTLGAEGRTDGVHTYYKHPKPAGNKCKHAGTEICELETFASGKQMRPVAGEKLRYNAWLRSKLMGVLAGVMLQVGSPYRKYYDNYKNRKTQAGWGTCDGHRHQAALRYMVKMLLLDIYKDWRTFEGLPVRPPYQEEYLNHKTTQRPVAQMSSTPPPPSLTGDLDIDEQMLAVEEERRYLDEADAS